MEQRIYDMVIIGGGPGGYTAALYAARAGLDVVVLERLSAGGQMAMTHQIDNYPGFAQGIDGFSLAEKMQEQAERFGAETAYADVTQVDLRRLIPRWCRPARGRLLGARWSWPLARTPVCWGWTMKQSWQAAAWPTALPVTGCSTGARPW